MAEVTSSSLVGSISENGGFAGETSRNQEGRERFPTLLDDNLTTAGTALGEYVFHRTRSVVSHTGDHVGIGIQRDRHGGMAQKLLDVLGMYVTAQ